MLRKAFYLLLALIACAFIVAGFDAVRHARAIDRLLKSRAHLGGWTYRFSGYQLGDPRRAEGSLRAWWLRTAAEPEVVCFGRCTVDEPMARDLAVVRMKNLLVLNCQVSPAAMKELSGISSIHQLNVCRSNVTDESLNLVWTGLPNLQVLAVSNHGIGEDAFRDIRRARRLIGLYWNGRNITDGVIARLREAPALEHLTVDTDGPLAITPASARVLAGMPALREVTWPDEPPDAAFLATLKELNPKLKITVR
jgi:hypothetical protein